MFKRMWRSCKAECGVNSASGQTNRSFNVTTAYYFTLNYKVLKISTRVSLSRQYLKSIWLVRKLS